MHLGALLARGDPVAHPDQLDALEPKARGDAQELGHVSREARQILDQDDLKGGRRAQRRREQLLVARTVFDAKAGWRRFLEHGDDGPALTLGIQPGKVRRPASN